MEIAEVKEQADKICENISRVLIGREKEIRVIPVSYTHLRAHET